MIGNSLGNRPFQTFFVSRESSHNPLTSAMIKLGTTLASHDIVQESRCFFSCSYGKRLLTTAEGVPLHQLASSDIVEVVDYDPVKNVAVAIGKQLPHPELPVHWIMHQARREMNVLFEIHHPSLVSRIQSVTTLEQVPPLGTIERAKEILRTLGDKKAILLNDEGAFLTGMKIDEIERFLLNMIEG